MAKRCRKMVRYTIDLSPEMNEEIKTLQWKLGGITKAEVFQTALALYKVVAAAIRQGEHIGVGKDQQSLKKEFVLR